MWETLGRCGERHFGKSFLRKCREIYGTRWNDGKGRKLFEEQGVMRAAAGDDELVDPVIGQDETMESVADGRRRERSGGVDEGGRARPNDLIYAAGDAGGGGNGVVRVGRERRPGKEKIFLIAATEDLPAPGFG